MTFTDLLASASHLEHPCIQSAVSSQAQENLLPACSLASVGCPELQLECPESASGLRIRCPSVYCSLIFRNRRAFGGSNPKDWMERPTREMSFILPDANP